MLARRFPLVVMFSLLLAAGCWAQDYPIRMVRIIVPFAPGAGTDLTARMLGKKLQENLGQTFVIDNRTGAGGMLAAETAGRSAADGYTLLYGTAALAGNATLRASSAFDPLKDLTPITLISISPNFVLVRPDFPAKSVKDLVEMAMKNPGKLNGGSAGNGSSTHLAIELFNQMAGVKVTHIPYKGGALSLVALWTGDTEIDFQGAMSSLASIRAGKVRALAVCSLTRMSAAPEIPTMDSFYPGFESVNWFALFAPAGTPGGITAKISAEVRRTLKNPEVADVLAREGVELVGSTPAELDAHFRREVERYAKFIKAANVRLE
jgi:tripartite-type tricarboxylate transporter receptor subunit TctC